MSDYLIDYQRVIFFFVFPFVFFIFASENEKPKKVKKPDSEKSEKPIQYFGRHKKPIARRKIPLANYIHTPRLTEELILLRKTFQKDKKRINIELIAVPVKNELPAFQLWDDGVLMRTLHFLEPAVRYFNAYADGVYKDEPK